MPRPHKGTRMRLNLRVPVLLYAKISRAATQAGMDVNEWCQRTLAEAVDIP